MSYILDAVIVIVLGLTIFFGYRRGFLQTVVQLVGCVAAFVIALSISSPAAAFVFDSYIAGGIETQLTQTLDSVADVPVEEKLDAAIAELPIPVAAILQNNTQLQTTIDELSENVSASVEALVESVVQTVIKPIVVALLQFVIFILAFLILMFVAKLLAKLIKPVSKLPLVRQVDGTLGALLGALKGALFVCVLIAVLQLVAATGGGKGPITQTALDNTWIVKYIADINPLSGFFA